MELDFLPVMLFETVHENYSDVSLNIMWCQWAARKSVRDYKIMLREELIIDYKPVFLACCKIKRGMFAIGEISS